MRLQVEHTVTEEVTGIDLVEAQLKIAAGARLADLKLRQQDIAAPSGIAIQARVNLETMQGDGSVRSAGGTIGVYEPPSGRGVRVDGYGYAGYRTNPRYDSLLAKVIVHTPADAFAEAAAKTERALAEFRIAGVPSNIPFLRALLKDPAILAGRHVHALHRRECRRADRGAAGRRALFRAASGSAPPQRAAPRRRQSSRPAIRSAWCCTARPARRRRPTPDVEDDAGPEGTVPLRAPMQGTIVSLSVEKGATVLAGQEVLVLEAMKMQHTVTSTVPGIVRAFTVAAGDTVFEGHPLAFIEERAELGGGSVRKEEAIDLDLIRPDLKEVLDRRDRALDAARPKAVARRRATGQRTARENIEDLCDPDTFVEYGSLVLCGAPAQRADGAADRGKPGRRPDHGAGADQRRALSAKRRAAPWSSPTTTR